MRLFIGIVLESEFFKSIQNRIEKDNLRAKFTNHYHITLKFLGDVNRPDHIIQSLSKIEFAPFDIVSGGIGFFPSRSKPKVIYVGFRGTELARLHQIIEKTLNLAPDKKFRPHVTLARVKKILDRGMLEQINMLDTSQQNFRVESFSLIESVLTPDGAEYRTLHEFRLS